MLENILNGVASDPNAGVPNISKPSELVDKVLPYLYGGAGIILLINIITSGFKIMNSQGDPKAMQEAQLKLKNSAIGILILFASFWIVQLLLKFLGIDLTLFG